MDLIVTDPDGTPTGSYASWTLDLAYGSGENDFDLQCHARLKPGCRWWVDGTGWGGIVDDVKTSVTGGEGELTYHGRDWHGLLASKILEPDKGKDYLAMSGTIGTLLRTVISRIGLQDLLTVDENTTKTANWQFDRYCDAWSGLSKMLRGSGLRLRVTAAQNGVTVDAPPITAAGDSIDSDLIDFDATLASHPVNHLICLGKGELKDRLVVHWYADAKGALSHTQTLKGADERTAVYELSNADAAELETKGKAKLQELRDTGSIDVDVTDGIDLDVGDTITGRDNTTGLNVTAEITKKIVKVEAGNPTVTYEATTAATESTGETGGGGASSGDGHAYYAGEGLTLTGWTFSADVKTNDLEAVRKTASEANKAASDAAAEIAGARDLATQADGKADKAQATADTANTLANQANTAALERVKTITASSPITASRNGDSVALSAPRTLPAPTSIDTTDLNDLKTTYGGYWAGGGNKCQNKPTGVGHFGLIVQRTALGWTTQILTDPQTNTIWRRTWNSNSWSEWKALAEDRHASQSLRGLMSSGDKKKLDGIQAGANNYTLPAATTSTLGGVKPDGKTITISEDGTITAQASAATASFLAAHPIGSLYWCATGDPNENGGTWKEIPTIIGGHVWQRLA